MQLCLSHLVDLSLGKPELMKGENFNILHTLLHVVLKKLNLSDAPVEINNEHAERAQGMLNELPKEPSICFKEFTFRNGVKVKKRNSNQLTAKRSIVQINKKWPKFAPNYCNTPATPGDKIDPKIIQEDLDALGQRVISLESKLCDMTNKFDAQNRVNCCALEDFEKLKGEFQEFKKSSENIDDENDTDCDNEEDEIDCVEEIKWIKERMLEFSESLKIQSECLKNLKCMEMPQVKVSLEERLECLEKLLENLRKQHKQDLDSIQSLKGNDMKEMQTQFECFKCQISCINNQLQEFEKTFIENQEMTCDELCSLRLEIMEKIQKFTSSNSIRTSHTSAILNTQNLQKVSCDVSKSSSHNNCINNNNENMQGNECCLNTSDSQISNEQSNQSICISITQRLCHIQKQVMSQSVCMQQLVRDLACKVDRREFECHCRKISDTIDTLLQLKADLQAAGANAAGTCTPMSCISCQTSANMTITTASVPKLPPLRYGRENIIGKFSQHEEINGCSNTNCADPQKSISHSNWSCYNFKPGPRKAGGSHTKVNRVMQVNRMRYKRLKTPSCATSRLNFCKSEFKGNSSIF